MEVDNILEEILCYGWSVKVLEMKPRTRTLTKPILCDLAIWFME